MPAANGNGYHFPRRLVAAALFVVAIFGAGFAVAQKIGAQIDRIQDLEKQQTDLEKQQTILHLRLCRIEVALNIPPWPGCPQ